MAQKVQTLFIDDIDGSTAEGTVRFGLDGTEYEIDLNTEHARQPRTPCSWLSSSDYGRDKPGALWLALTERALTTV